MKAILMSAPGTADVLTLEEVPMPQIAKADEMLVRLKAAGVNPVDTKLRNRGTFYPDRLPTILGCDGAGIVETIGKDVTKFKVGDEVYFCNGGIGGHPGNYAEYAVVNEQFAAAKPKSISFAEAAAAPLVLITAWESLFDSCELEDENTVLIHAGAGGVGHVAIQLAKAAGARVCTTVGSAEKAEFVRGLGADKVIQYKDEDFVKAVLEWTDGKGVDLAFDTVGGKTLNRTFEAVRFYGDIVTLLQPDANTDWKTARMRNQRLSLELMLTPMQHGLFEVQAHHGEILADCAELFDSGDLKIHVSHTLPLAEAAEAHRLVESGGMVGKVVLTMD
ncbi:MAG: zinc-dependent alcohol dehydrogenase family protein [Pseudomonadota bacterium]|nr:zinc-dependent alcohol dehydrogenase family protein [Pseudomonadota bacterium]